METQVMEMVVLLPVKQKLDGHVQIMLALHHQHAQLYEVMEKDLEQKYEMMEILLIIKDENQIELEWLTDGIALVEQRQQQILVHSNATMAI